MIRNDERRADRDREITEKLAKAPSLGNLPHSFPRRSTVIRFDDLNELLRRIREQARKQGEQISINEARYRAMNSR